MNSDQWLEDVAARAITESPPRMDVADAVAARIRGLRTDEYDATAIVAGSSVAAAAIVLAYAIQTLSALQDPFSTLMASMNLVLR